MTDRLRHRGPDGGGYFHAPWLAFGHRRLAIIDRAGGEQPMTNEDRSVWIVFNGEVYNHRELRRELKARGHQFRTQSDTEAIIHAYEEYGDDCVDHLDGMFAFAIGDLRRRRLLLARDRLGKKPLFHATFDGVLHFASEIKAIKASPLWNGERDLAAIEGYLSLGYFVAPSTAYRYVRKLEPARVLRAENGRVGDSHLLGPQGLRYRPARPEGLARRGRCAVVVRGRQPPRKRSADRRVPLRRDRLGPDRVVHGRSAAAARRSPRRSDSITPPTTSWKRPA